MKLGVVLEKAWRILWNYRALWLFGAILALVGASLLFVGPWPDPENDDQWIKFKLADTTTIRVPGADVTLDFTAPEGVRVLVPDRASWLEFRDLVDELDRQTSIDLRLILIEFAVISVLLLLLAVVARYVAETSVIRMVDEAEETGQRLSVWQGVRKGWSFRARRLFVLDLVVGILRVLAFVVVFGLALAPLLLAIGSREFVLITVGMGTVGLLVVAAYVWLAASLALSLVLQPVRRACVLEEQDLAASIRQGLMLTRQHAKEVGLVWLVWLGIRLLLIPLGALFLILLAPVLLLTTLAGVVLGAVPAALIALLTSLSTSGATPWIMGALAGLPIFTIVMISPMLFVSGLMEIYMSSIWTLAYRELRAMECTVPAAASLVPLAPAHSAAH
jgi:hypothetical protein